LQHGANGFPKAHKVTDSQNCKAFYGRRYPTILGFASSYII